MNKKKGFTLVENVIAVFLLGIVVVATAFSLATARMYTASARHHYRAVSIARGEIERIIAGENPSPGTVTIDVATGLTGTMSISNPTAQTVDVTVSWTEEMWTDVSKKETIVLFLP